MITADVVALREDIGAPGMAVLQFAWGSGAANPHLPHNHYENCVVYPGATASPYDSPINVWEHPWQVCCNDAAHCTNHWYSKIASRWSMAMRCPLYG